MLESEGSMSCLPNCDTFIDKSNSWEKSNIDTEGIIKDFSRAIVGMSKTAVTTWYEQAGKQTKEDQQEDNQD